MAAGPLMDFAAWLPVRLAHCCEGPEGTLRACARRRALRYLPIHVPERSDYLVENIEAQGGVVLAKSNTPEFGAGANTFNEVFGKTRNPWDTRMTCGGSSGGSAVALATGQVWLATGSDLGGSLRIPASFCSVVGLRPSAGVCLMAEGVAFRRPVGRGPYGAYRRGRGAVPDTQAGMNAVDPMSMPRPDRPFTSAVDEPRLAEAYRLLTRPWHRTG